MKRKHKKYSRPKRMFDKVRIDKENALIEKYGLKNKREIWKAQAKINDFRDQAKSLITADMSEQEKLIKKLQKNGFNVSNIADILALTEEDMLKRRLQSVVVEKKIAKTPKEGRQLIVHKHVTINKKILNKPSYLVPVEEENKIELKLKRIKNG